MRVDKAVKVRSAHSTRAIAPRGGSPKPPGQGCVNRPGPKPAVAERPDLKTSNTALFGLAAVALAAAPLQSHGEECEGAPSANKLSIIVEGVRSDHGQMTASLYPDDKTKFLAKGGSLKVWRVPAESPVTNMCIWLKAPGTYGVAIYHDANANGRLDLGMLGPSEDYGFSRNPRIMFSKPSLAAVRFPTAGAETTLHIRLNRGH